jgi:hypothetical protein
VISARWSRWTAKCNLEGRFIHAVGKESSVRM